MTRWLRELNLITTLIYLHCFTKAIQCSVLIMRYYVYLQKICEIKECKTGGGNRQSKELYIVHVIDNLDHMICASVLIHLSLVR